MKKIIIVALLLCLCVCICACTGNPQESATPSSGTVTNDPAHTHNYGQWTISVAATCTEDGEEKRTCECGAIETKTIDKIAHTEVVDSAVDATCTKTGLTEGKHCSVCNTVIVEQKTIQMQAHTEVVDKAVAPTCTKTGLTEGKHCSVCNAVIVEQKTVRAKGHTEVVDKAVAATCTETGLTEGKHCSVCNAILVTQNELPATHNDPHGICTICNKVTDKEAAKDYYFDVKTSLAEGKIITTYYKNELYAQHYISDVTYDVRIGNTWDSRIYIDIIFYIYAPIIKRGEYYSGTSFATYVIALNNSTLRAFYTTITAEEAQCSASIYLDSIDELYDYSNTPRFYLNVGDYHMG